MADTKEKNVTAGAMLAFKVGNQTTLNGMLANGGTNGTFYLTKDTHRLYIGNEDGSISAVNEGIVTVQNYETLTSTSNGIVANPGEFYYLTTENILCVCAKAGENNIAGKWVQINPDTTLSSLKYTTTVASDVATIKIAARQSDNTEADAASASFKITGANGITIEDDDTTGTGAIEGIKITGETYSIATVANAASNTADVKLAGNKSGNNSIVSFVGGNNVTLTNDTTNNKITIASKDTHINGFTVTKEKDAGETIKSGYKFDITTNDEAIKFSQSIDPEIKYGHDENGNTTAIAKFKDDAASLDIYTAGQVDTLINDINDDIEDKLQALNAMHYRGTVGTNGSAGTELTYADGKITGITGYVDGTNVKGYEVGDTFLLSEDLSYKDEENIAKTVQAGSLLVALGAEDNDGFIPAGKISFDIVSASNNTDTQYSLQGTANSNSGVVKLIAAGDEASAGQITISGATAVTDVLNIKVTPTVSSTKKETTFVIEHDKRTVTPTADATANQTQTAGASKEFTVISSVGIDATGHVSEIKTAKYTVVDTNASVKNVSSTVAAENNVATVTTGVTLQHEKDAYNNSDSKSSSFTVASNTLTITADTTENKQQLVMDITWGSF